MADFSDWVAARPEKLRAEFAYRAEHQCGLLSLPEFHSLVKPKKKRKRNQQKIGGKGAEKLYLSAFRDEEDEAGSSHQHETPAKKGKDDKGEAFEQVGAATQEQINVSWVESEC